MANENERKDFEREDETSQDKNAQPSSAQGEQGQSASGQTAQSGGPGETTLSERTGSSSEPEGGFVGSESEDSSDYLQQGRDQPNQGGFAEQGRGAPEGSGQEGSGERTANDDSDIEGSSKS